MATDHPLEPARKAHAVADKAHAAATRMDVRAFALAGETLSGDDSLSKYERVGQYLRRQEADLTTNESDPQRSLGGASPTPAEVAGVADAPDAPEAPDIGAVQWTAQGQAQAAQGDKQSNRSQIWLYLTARASTRTVCQRCLGGLDLQLDIQRSFRFVADEATAAAQDDESEEDLLVLSKTFDLHALIEDELLMALPIVPKHEVCPQAVKLASTDDEFQAAMTQKPNAFAALGSLRKLV